MENETLITVDAARELLPEIEGRKPSTTAIRNWCKRGCYGVRLEHIRVGGRILTTREALERFSERVRDAAAVVP